MWHHASKRPELGVLDARIVPLFLLLLIYPSLLLLSALVVMTVFTTIAARSGYRPARLLRAGYAHLLGPRPVDSLVTLRQRNRGYPVRSSHGGRGLP